MIIEEVDKLEDAMYWPIGNILKAGILMKCQKEVKMNEHVLDAHVAHASLTLYPPTFLAFHTLFSHCILIESHVPCNYHIFLSFS